MSYREIVSLFSEFFDLDKAAVPRAELSDKERFYTMKAGFCPSYVSVIIKNRLILVLLKRSVIVKPKTRILYSRV